MFAANKRQHSSRRQEKKPCSSPGEKDILCGKDKTYAKHAGNRLFRERIEVMKVSYVAAPSKQEKMAITKGIVTYMQVEHGCRFVKKLENNTWAEINNQAARDKVSHALRFAARNLKTSETTSNSTASTSNKKAGRRPRRMQSSQSDESSVSTSTSNQSETVESEEGEPVPLSKVFGENFSASGISPSFFPYDNAEDMAMLTNDAERPVTSSFPIDDPHTQTPMFQPRGMETFNSDDMVSSSIIPADYQDEAPPTSYGRGFLAEQPPLSFPETREDDFVDITRQSLRSLQIDDDSGALFDAPPIQPFDTLRSADLDEIFNEPMDNEWEAVAKLAES